MASAPPEAKRPKATLRTFKAAADEFIEARDGIWKHPAHRAQWRLSIAHVPSLHKIRVDEITASDVASALTPLQDRPETLKRTRGRIEKIIDAELIALGMLDKANPAALRLQSHLTPALSPDRRRKVKRAVKHHAALTTEAVRDLWPTIPNSTPGRALRLTILSACRTSEIRLARWRDYDAKTATLTIPTENTKTGVAHVVPLPPVGDAIVGKPGNPEAFIFSGRVKGKPISQDAMRMTLRRIGVAADDGTVHGFRSSFRDWARNSGRDETLAELALGHLVGDDSQRAYARSSALERRRELMHQWAEAVSGTAEGAQ